MKEANRFYFKDFLGAAGRSRTDTDVSPADFESAASASFTTAAFLMKFFQMRELSENFARILGQRKNQFLGFIKDTANDFQKKCA